MPRALQISGMATPLASSASASRSLRMICSGEWRIRFIESPPALTGENDSHIGWTRLRGAGQINRYTQKETALIHRGSSGVSGRRLEEQSDQRSEEGLTPTPHVVHEL